MNRLFYCLLVGQVADLFRMCGGRTGGGDESRRLVGQDGILRRVGNPPSEGWRAVEPKAYSRLSRVRRIVNPPAAALTRLPLLYPLASQAI